MQMVAKRDVKKKADKEEIILHTQYHRQNIMNPFYLQAMREAENGAHLN